MLKQSIFRKAFLSKSIFVKSGFGIVASQGGGGNNGGGEIEPTVQLEEFIISYTPFFTSNVFIIDNNVFINNFIIN